MGTVHRELSLYSNDGLQLYAQRWEPEAGARAEVLIVHGYFDHSNRFRDVARTLADAGIAVTAADLRGHGRSEGPRGFVRHFEDYLDDVQAALQSVPRGPPRFLLGHSMGGLVTLDFVARRPAARELAGLLVTSPYLGLAIPVPAWKKKLGDVAAEVWPRLGVPSGLDAADLSHDTAVVDAYRRDPLVFQKATAGWFKEITLAQARVMATTRLELPLLYYYSDSDRIVSPPAAKAFGEAVATPDKTVRLRAGSFHEILNEPAHRGEVLDEMKAWMLARAGAGKAERSGA